MGRPLWLRPSVVLACIVIVWRGSNALSIGLRKRPRKGPRILHTSHPLAMDQTAPEVRGRGLSQRALGDSYVQQVPITGDFAQMAVFEATVWIGTPPQQATAIVDTGSTLLAIPCTSCTHCGTHDGLPPIDMSKSSTARPCQATSCTFSQHYFEGDGVDGTWWNDMVFLGAGGQADAGANSFYDRSQVSFDYHFGCTTKEGGMFYDQIPDGIIGLGWHTSPKSYVDAAISLGLLKEPLFTMCLDISGGTMTLGGIDVSQHMLAGGRRQQNASASPLPTASPSASPSAAPRVPVTWLRNPNPGGSFYVVSVNSFRVQGQAVVSSGYNAGSGVIVDSGTSFSYLPPSVFPKVEASLASFCSEPGKCGGNSRVSVSQEGFCLRLSSADVLSQPGQFPSMSFDLVGADGSSAILSIAPKHYMLHMDWDGSGVYCFGFYSNRAGNPALIGANAMMGYDFIFHFGDKRVGFVPIQGDSCTFNPAFGTVSETPSPHASVSSPPIPSVSASQSPPASPTPHASGPPSASPTPSPSPSPSLASPSPSVSASAQTATVSPTARANAPAGENAPVGENASNSSNESFSPGPQPSVSPSPEDESGWASSFVAGIVVGGMLCGAVGACTVIYAASCSQGAVSCCGMHLVVGRSAAYSRVGEGGGTTEHNDDDATHREAGATHDEHGEGVLGFSDAHGAGGGDDGGIRAASSTAVEAHGDSDGDTDGESDDYSDDHSDDHSETDNEDASLGGGSIELVDAGGGRRLSFEGASTGGEEDHPDGATAQHPPGTGESDKEEDIV